MADFANGNGLAIADKYYSQYGVRAQELKGSGKKIIGYLSALGPVEILTAAGVVPFRLKGNVSEAITKGDAFLWPHLLAEGGVFVLEHSTREKVPEGLEALRWETRQYGDSCLSFFRPCEKE